MLNKVTNEIEEVPANKLKYLLGNKSLYQSILAAYDLWLGGNDSKNRWSFITGRVNKK